MPLVFLAVLLYFLPAIIAHNKRDFTAILLVNLFFGWTVIGWIVALIWACAADVKPPVLLIAGPAAGLARYCCRCGAVASHGGRFCAVCGSPL